MIPHTDDRLFYPEIFFGGQGYSTLANGILGSEANFTDNLEHYSAACMTGDDHFVFTIDWYDGAHSNMTGIQTFSNLAGAGLTFVSEVPFSSRHLPVEL